MAAAKAEWTDRERMLGLAAHLGNIGYSGLHELFHTRSAEEIREWIDDTFYTEEDNT